MRLLASRHRPRQRDAWLSLRRFALDLGSSGIGQAQEFGSLVERFAQRIVERRAEALVVADALDDEKLGVSARNEQEQIGKVEPIGEPGGERVRLEMIDGDEGAPKAERDRLPGCHPDDETADEAGAGRSRHRVDRAEVESGLGKRLADRRIEKLDMGARGNLGHDAAIGGMEVELRAHHARQDLAPSARSAADERCGGLVAARLDPEHGQRGVFGGGVHGRFL